MKIMHKLLASASALAICLSSAPGAMTTNGWFAVDFEDAAYVVDSPVAGVATWTKSGTSDASKIIDIDLGEPATKGNAVNKIVKLDTQGDQLTWTPSAASTKDVVLIDTDVYLVGSDVAPETVPTGVQTEVYLKNLVNTTTYAVTGSVLCAHVYDGAANVWVDLDGVAVSHQSWVKLRIELNYETANQPMVSFWVNGIRMEKVGSSTWSFRAMDASKTAVNSVSFMGTGYIDNFIGREVEEQAAGTTFDPLVSTNGVPAFAGGTLDTTTTPGTLFATFDDTLGGETLQYVQLVGQGGAYVRTYRTSDGDAAKFDVSGLAAGTYSVTAYYGDAPTVVPSEYAPAAEAGGGKPAAEVVTEGEAKILRVNVKPVSGLHYTLFVGTDGAQPGDLSASAASTLAYPVDEDAGFLQIDLPAPTTANGVNLIKIYASDEAYAADADAPDAPPAE